MIRHIIQQGAQRDVRDAAQWYASQSKSAAANFVADYEKGVKVIRAFPFLSPVFEGTTRKHNLSRFPFGVVYEVEPNLLKVIAVIDLRRKPGYWKSRNKVK